MHGFLTQSFQMTTDAIPTDRELPGIRHYSVGYFSYRLPTIMDVPEQTQVFVNSLDSRWFYGTKGFGETSIGSVPGAIANAIYHACGVRIREHPITREKIMAGLKELEARAQTKYASGCRVSFDPRSFRQDLCVPIPDGGLAREHPDLTPIGNRLSGFHQLLDSLAQVNGPHDVQRFLVCTNEPPELLLSGEAEWCRGAWHLAAIREYFGNVKHQNLISGSSRDDDLLMNRIQNKSRLGGSRSEWS